MLEQDHNEAADGLVTLLRTKDARTSIRFNCDVPEFTQDWLDRFEEGFPAGASSATAPQCPPPMTHCSPHGVSRHFRGTEVSGLDRRLSSEELHHDLSIADD